MRTVPVLAVIDSPNVPVPPHVHVPACAAYSVNLGDKLQSGTMWQLRGQPRSNQIFLNDEPLAYHYPTAASAQQQQQQQQQQAGGKGPGLPPMPGKEVAALELPPVSVTFVQYPPPSARV
jgi:hypothetical protein